MGVRENTMTVPCSFILGATMLAIVETASRSAGQPVDGSWSDWSLSSSCSATCGDKGFVFRRRKCDNPAPFSGGQECKGHVEELSSIPCGRRSCPFPDPQAAIAKMSRTMNTANSSQLQSLVATSAFVQQSVGTGVPGYGTCQVYGDPHYLTFDRDKPYDYMTSCSYYLVHDKDVTRRQPRFNVVIRTGECVPTSSRSKTSRLTCVVEARIDIYACSIPSNATVSALSVNIFFPEGDITLNGKDITSSLPEFVEDRQLLIHRQGGETSITSYDCGIEIRTTTPWNIDVLVADVYRNQVGGLCGTFNGNPADDFTTWDGNVVSDGDVSTFANSWQLPSEPGHDCVAPDITPGCPTQADRETLLLCDMLDRGGFTQCLSHLSSLSYTQSCMVDVCDCQDKPKCACNAYVTFARACMNHNVYVNLTQYPGCEAPTVTLSPMYASEWEGSNVTFTCESSGWPPAPIEFSRSHGFDIDTLSPHTIKRNTNNSKKLYIHHLNAKRDDGTVTCCVDNIVGRACQTAELIVKVGQFEVDCPAEQLIGSKISVSVRKEPLDFPSEQVTLTVVTPDTLTEIAPLVPHIVELEDVILVDLTSLVSGAQFDMKYRLRVRDSVTPEYEGYSNEFVFKRDRIQIDIPVTAEGVVLSDQTVVLGLPTRFAFQFSQNNIYLSEVSFACSYLNGTVARDIGTISADKRRPNTVEWMTDRLKEGDGDISSGTYQLSAYDSQTSARGTSNRFAIEHGSFCVVHPSHVTYGEVVSFFIKVQPANLPVEDMQYYVVRSENCLERIAEITDDIRGTIPGEGEWRLLKQLAGVMPGISYRIAGRSGAPSFLSFCSEDTVTFNTGSISVEACEGKESVYIDRTCNVAIKVSADLQLVESVMVDLFCDGNATPWSLSDETHIEPGLIQSVSWHVGHSDPARPLPVGSKCHIQVKDAGQSGAVGISSNFTVASACVIVPPYVKTGEELHIGVTFSSFQNLSQVIVHLVDNNNVNKTLFTIPPSEIAVGDNALKWQHVMVPFGFQSGMFIIRVDNPLTGGFGLSNPIIIEGWNVTVIVTSPYPPYDPVNTIYPAQTVRIDFTVNDAFLQLVGCTEFKAYLRRTTGNADKYSIGGGTRVCPGDSQSSDTGIARLYPSGDYFIYVEDTGERFAVSGHSQELRVFNTSLNKAAGNEIIDNHIVNADASDRTVTTHRPEQNGPEGDAKTSRSTDGSTIAGIVVGCVVAVAVLVAFAIWILAVRKRRRKGDYENL